jgi:hypothetical protein
MTAAASAAVSVCMTMSVAAAAHVFGSVFSQFCFFGAATLGAGDFVTVLAAFGARLDFPLMIAVQTLKYAISHERCLLLFAVLLYLVWQHDFTPK